MPAGLAPVFDAEEGVLRAIYRDASGAEVMVAVSDEELEFSDVTDEQGGRRAPRPVDGPGDRGDRERPAGAGRPDRSRPPVDGGWYLQAQFPDGTTFVVEAPAAFTQAQVLQFAAQVTYTP